MSGGYSRTFERIIPKLLKGDGSGQQLALANCKKDMLYYTEPTKSTPAMVADVVYQTFMLANALGHIYKYVSRLFDVSGEITGGVCVPTRRGQGMTLLRYGQPCQEKTAIMAADGSLWDLFADVLGISPQTLDPQVLAELRVLDLDSLPMVEEGVRIGAPIGSIGKLGCVGLNYTDHAKESNLPVPSEPVMFMKATSTIYAPND